MKKKNDPPFGEPPIPSLILHPFSSNRELNEEEWFALRLASTTSFRTSEPKTIRKARSRIASAEIANDHLLKNGLTPVFDSFEFEGMRLKEGARK
jgi:hypothetical protein